MKGKATFLHLAIITVLVFVILIRVDWSVALLCGWMAYSLSACFTALGRVQRAMKAIDLQHRELLNRLNTGAAAFAKEMRTCHECEIHGKEGIRPGSLHNRTADNCLMNYERKVKI